MALIDKLVGNDGFLSTGEIGADLVGDGVKTLDVLVGGGVGSGARFYQIQALGGASAISALNANFKVGDYFYNSGGLIPAVGDIVKKLPGFQDDEKNTSIKSFEISLTKDKIDTTTLTDSLKTYRMGRGDAAGTTTGVTRVGDNSFSSRFLTKISQQPDGTGTTIDRSTNAPIYFVGVLQGNLTSGETGVAIVGKVELESYNYNATDGSAQEFTTGFAPSASGGSTEILQNVEIVVP